MMTRKTFQAAANTIKTVTNKAKREAMIAQFSATFAASNPRFDVAKFRKACEPEAPKAKRARKAPKGWTSVEIRSEDFQA